jgi:8-oxo-dGTP diphosphatase
MAGPAPSPPAISPTLVVAAVISRDDRVLICRRPAHKHHGDLWEFPGGKIHDGESPAAALKRELSEELGVRVSQSGDPLYWSEDTSAGVEILFIPTSIEGEPVALEHSAITWCPRSDLLSYSLAPSDRKFAKFLVEGDTCQIL